MARHVDRAALAGFIAEVSDYLPVIRQAAEMPATAEDLAEALEQAHRLLHSIKGTASMIGLSALSHVAWLAEELMEDVGGGLVEVSDHFAELLLGTTDAISGYLHQLDCGEDASRPLLTAMVPSFRRFRSLPESGDADEITRFLTVSAPSSTLATMPSPAALEPSGVTSGERVTGAAPLPEDDELEPSQELFETFRDEADEHLQRIASLLRRLEKGPANRSTIQDMRRSVHTLKGAASMVGFSAVGHLAHRMEDLLDALYEGSFELDEEITSLLFATADGLEDLVQKDPTSDRPPAVEALYERYSQLLVADPQSLSATLRESLGEEKVIDLTQTLKHEPSLVQPVSERAQPSEMVRIPLRRLDEVVRLVSELVVHRSVFERHHGALTRQVGELRFSMGRLQQISNRFDTEYEAAALLGGAKVGAVAGAGPVVLSPQPAPQDFDELELDRYTEFHLLSRGLTEATSDLRTGGSELQSSSADIHSALGRLGRLTGEIQDKLMRLRMVSLATLASRLYRAVRVTAGKCGKQAQLKIEGEAVELDKSVLEELVGPLLHMVRNAVDHGIEPPALRAARGKPTQGTVRLAARYEGTEVVIEVEDDGAGLDAKAIRDRAIERELLPAARADELTTTELYALVFQPGFTTAAEVSEISGRGVGLDVVKMTVERLKGTISIDSQPGAWARLTVRMPMTLAITRVLLVHVSGQRLAIPMAAIDRILRVERSELETVGGRQVLAIDGKVCPLLDLGAELGFETSAEETTARPPVVVLGVGERKLAITVDRLEEAREVVVKNLGNLIRGVAGISGATLTGDGGVVLIVHPPDLLREREVAAAATSTSPRAVSPIRTETDRRSELEVLIVDDSLTVRRVLANLIKSSGWKPTTAKDGVEALEVLHRAAHAPDVILLDIEMPRMDGYELTATLRNQSEYAQVPIVMITSRAGQKHRQRAFDLGASEYMVKPYQAETLLAVVRRLTRGSGSVGGQR